MLVDMHQRKRHQHRLSRSRHRNPDGSWMVGARIERFAEPAVLLTLDEGETHGYELADGLAEWLPDDRIDLGNLYRMMRSLEAEGIVESEWHNDHPGRSKRTYRLTDDGRDLLAAWVAALEATQSTIARFVRQSRKGEQP
jgi:DNA-binding PadR family transcriptional regulator